MPCEDYYKGIRKYVTHFNTYFFVPLRSDSFCKCNYFLLIADLWLKVSLNRYHTSLTGMVSLTSFCQTCDLLPFAMAEQNCHAFTVSNLKIHLGNKCMPFYFLENARVMYPCKKDR